jgi:hypothetical protein
MYTDEVDDEASVGGSASGAAEEGLAVREVAERDRKHGCGELHEIAGVGVRVAEGEDGAKGGAVARVRLTVMYTGDDQQENQNHGL